MAISPVDPKTYVTDYVKSDYDSITFLGNSHIDALVLAVQSLGGDLWSTRRRLYIVEALMEKKMAVTPAAIQGYVPTSEEEQRWKGDRDMIIAGVMRPFLRADIGYASPEMMKYDPNKEPDLHRVPAIQVGKPPV